MFPGMPNFGNGFDFNALQEVLNDPAIKAMAESISKDPSFKEVTERLQESLGGLMGPGGMPGMGGPGGMPGMPPMSGMPGMPGMPPMGGNMDPSKYMEAMSGMFNNPSFMQMAESLGKSIIQSDPNMAKMMEQMADPTYKQKVEGALSGLKEDPELKPLLDEMEKTGPMAMMQHWNNPEILEKLGKAMGGVFDFPGLVEGEEKEGEEAKEGEEEEEEEEEDENTVIFAASHGDVEKLKTLLEAGASANEADEEGRTALHFAAGYGELDCCRELIKAKANVNAVDNEDNTPLHYAAGYGEVESIKLLVESGADKAFKNKNGTTAEEVAKLNEHKEIEELLQVKEEAADK